MIGCSQKNRENYQYPKKCFETKENQTRIKIKLRVSAYQPLKNWAQNKDLVAANQDKITSVTQESCIMTVRNNRKLPKHKLTQNATNLQLIEDNVTVFQRP